MEPIELPIQPQVVQVPEELSCTPEESQERLNFCLSCEEMDKEQELTRCKMCSCLINYVTTIKFKECPKGNW